MVNIVIPEPKHSPIADLIKKVQEGQHPSSRLEQKFVCPSAHSDVAVIQEDYKCTLIKGVVFPTYDQAKEYADAALLPNFGQIVSEIKAEKTETTKTL